MTLTEAKDLIAKKYNKSTWYDWGYEFIEPYGKCVPDKYYDEAAELYAKSKQEWISVKDRLPESLVNVTVFYDDGITGFTSRGFHSGNKIWTVMTWSEPIETEITHWMPLPEPPNH